MVFPNGTRNEYTVDVIKYWTLDNKQLIDKKLYNLLPLQLFTLRAELDKITADDSEASKQEAITKAKATIDKIVKIVEQLYQDNEFNADDHDKIITGLAELIKHLDERYKLNQKLSGVNDVIKVLNIARKAENKGEQKRAVGMAEKMLLNKEPIEKIIDYTELTEKRILAIKKRIKI